MKRLGTFYENKLLWQVIKGEPSEKVLRFMLENYKFDMTLSQIHHETGVSRTAIRRLVKKGVLVKTRQYSDFKYYKLKD